MDAIIERLGPEIKAVLKQQFDGFVIKFGREPFGYEPIFFDPEALGVKPIAREKIPKGASIFLISRMNWDALAELVFPD